MTTEPTYEKCYQFIGYGNPEAKLRFLGKEEGLGGPAADIELNDNARAEWNEVEDLYEAHRTLHENGAPIDISKPRTGSTLVWRFMSVLALAAEGGDPGKLTRDDYVHYMQHKLGRSDGTTFLTEMYPIPSANNCRRRVVGNLSQDQRNELLAGRKSRQMRILRSNPGVTICYGVGKASDYARHLGVTWRELPDLDRVYVADGDDTTFLTPFFGTGQWSYEKASAFANHTMFRDAIAKVSSP